MKRRPTTPRKKDKIVKKNHGHKPQAAGKSGPQQRGRKPRTRNTTTKPKTQEGIILDILTDQRGKWVPMPALAVASGSLNIHSRIDALRHKRGVKIENRTVVVGGESGQMKVSSYRMP